VAIRVESQVPQSSGTCNIGAETKKRLREYPSHPARLYVLMKGTELSGKGQGEAQPGELYN
jgi:hypothetical protein